MFGLCKYKDIFGKAGDTTKPRVLGVRILDIVIMVLFVLAFSYITKNNIWKMFAFFLILMVFFHRIFCVRSATDKLLFSGNENDAKFAGFVILGILAIYYFKLYPRF